MSLAALFAIGASFVAPHTTDVRHAGLLNAPPTWVRFVEPSGVLRRPFIYRWNRVNQLEQRYEADTSAPIDLVWFQNGHVVQSSEPERAPLLLLGADAYGRDVFSRLLFAARTSLVLSLLSALGAVVVGGIVGAAAGYVGGVAEDTLMRATEFVVVLPVMYAALVLRAALPLVLAPRDVFLLLFGIFAIVGSPSIARGVRGIVRSERALEYATAAMSLGASHWRVLARHLLPATRGFLVVQVTLLVPSFIVAEATLSYVGLGFPEPVASWGTMLQEASSLRALTDFWWLLSPAAAMFAVVLGLNLVLEDRGALARSTMK